MGKGRRTNLRDSGQTSATWSSRVTSGYGIALGVLGLLLIVGFSAVALWRYVEPFVVEADEYRLRAEDIHVTPPPQWIKHDLPEEVIRAASLDSEPSILDDRLAAKVARAFATHPWVARVTSVSVRHPARVDVELVYRRPVCMVELPRSAATSDGGLYPIDASGVLLPSADFTPHEASLYPRLETIRSYPSGIAGQAWGDPRVDGGAAVTAVLSDNWRELGLDRIVPSAEPVAASGDYEYELFTRRGRRILWGRSPMGSTDGEPAAAEKLQRLKRIAAEFGSLDAQEAPTEIDLRSPPEPRTATRPTDR